MMSALAHGPRGPFGLPKKEVESFLQYLQGAILKEAVISFDMLLSKLPIMPRTRGFFVEVVSIISPYLYSQNEDVAFAALDVIETVVSEYGKQLDTFAMSRRLVDLQRCDKPDQLTYSLVRNSALEMIKVNPSCTMYRMGRLMAVSSEEMRLEITALLFEYVMSAGRIDRAVVSGGWRIALESLLFPWSGTQLVALDLVYALCYRGTSKETLVKFFVNRKAPKKLLNAVRELLQRRASPGTD